MTHTLDIKPGDSIRLSWPAGDAVDIVSEGEMMEAQS